MTDEAGMAHTGAQRPVKRMIHKALDVLLSFLRIFIFMVLSDGRDGKVVDSSLSNMARTHQCDESPHLSMY